MTSLKAKFSIIQKLCFKCAVFVFHDVILYYMQYKMSLYVTNAPSWFFPQNVVWPQ